MEIYFNQLKKYLKELEIKENIINEIINCYTVKLYNKDDYFSYESKLNDKVGFIIKGLFYMYIIKQDGTIFTKDFISKDQILLSTFDPEKESLVNIQSLTNSIILEAKYSNILKLFSKYHELESIGKKGIEKRTLDIYSKLELFATMDSKEKYNFFKKQYGDIENNIPQYLIASYLGITPTQLSRIRKKYNLI